MAKGIQIPIEVVDKFSKSMADMESKLGAIGKAAEKQGGFFDGLGVAITGALSIGAIVEFGRASLQAFAESEKSIVRLDQAMKNQGITSKQYRDSLLDQAAALQQVTAYSDEAVRETQTLLTTFGLAGEPLKKTTKAALDLSTGLGIDLRSATMLLGKAWAGETGALSRFGIKIDETKTGAEKFAAVMEQVNKRFGGSAQAEAASYAGQVAIMTNRFDELKEKIGKELLPVADQWIKWINWGMGAIERAAEGDRSLTKSKDAVHQAMRQNIVAMQDEITTLAGSDGANVAAQNRLIELRKELALLTAQYAEHATMLKSRPTVEPEADPVSKAAVDTDAVGKAAKLAEETEARQQSRRDELEVSLNTSNDLKDIKAQRLADELGMFGNHKQAEQVLAVRVAEKEKALNQARIANVSSTLNFISTLQQAKSKELVAIGKAAAAANIMISTGQAIMGAWASLSGIPVVGPALASAAAAVVGVAGAAQMAMVAGVQMREGGLVNGSSGGIQATIGEDGRSEAVIPLENSNAMRRIGEAISAAGGSRGGSNINLGGITVNINGGNLGDPAQRRSMLNEFADEMRRGASEAIEAALLSSQLANRHQLRAV